MSNRSSHPLPNAAPCAREGEISVYAALAVCHHHGALLTETTWRSYVSRYKAPRPANHLKREPFWDQDAVAAWARERSDGRNDTGRSAPAPLRITTPLDAADANTPMHERAQMAVEQLPATLRGLDRAIANARNPSTVSAGAPPSSDSAGERLAGTIRQAEISTTLAPPSSLDRAEQQVAELEAARLHVARDLSAAQEWLEHLARWALRLTSDTTEAKPSAANATWRASTLQQGEAWLDRAVPVLTWAHEDPRRIAYIHPHGGREGVPWRDASAAELDGLGVQEIRLDGVVYAGRWEIPGSTGRWSLAWSPRTSELYLENELHSARPDEGRSVVPVAQLPTGSTQETVAAWLDPFLAIGPDPLAAGLLAGEVALQESLRWPSIAR